MIKFSCKKCGQKLNVEDKHSGKRVKCPKCGSVSVVPDNSDKIKFHCKNCGQSISVPQIHAGKKGRCPKCKNPVVIPSLKKEPAGASETFIIVVCPMCNETIRVQETLRGQAIECPSCGSYVETTSESAAGESDTSIPPRDDVDQYEGETEGYEESEGMDRRLILVISGVAAVVVVGLIILVTVILPSGSRPDEEPIEVDLLPKPGDVVLNSIGMKLVYIPAGSFMMGSSDSSAQLAREYNIKEEFSDEFPQHQVRISKGFWMGQTEITQDQYKLVMNAQPWSGKPLVQEFANNPAVYVSWDEAAAFCRKLSQKEGKTYRLPTEAEWEYACRAGTTTRFSFGDSDSSLGDHAWFYDNTDKVDQDYAHPVGQKKSNPWGLYDMHGNVWERCSDRYDKNYYSNSPNVDPKGPSSGTYRSLRGGSWLNHEYSLRCSYRSNLPFDPDLHIGFRVVCSQIIPLPGSNMEPDRELPRQEVADTYSRPQPVTSETQPTEPIVQELQKEESLPAVQYKLKFEKGQSYYVRVISDSNSFHEVNGQQSVSKVTTGFGYSFDVNEVDEKGNGWVDCTVDWVKLMRKAPMIDVTYDSSEKTSRVPPLAQSVAMYLGESFSAKMTPQGQVEELRGLEKLHRSIEKKMPKGRTEQQILQTLDSEELANSIKNLFLSPMAVYPDKPVGVGDSWNRTGFLTGLESFILENKWTLQDRKAGIAIIEVSASIKSQPDAVQKQDVKIKYDMSGKQTGQIKIKESTGQIIFSKLNQDLSGQAQADDMTIRMKTYAVTTFEMSRRD